MKIVILSAIMAVAVRGQLIETNETYCTDLGDNNNIDSSCQAFQDTTTTALGADNNKYGCQDMLDYANTTDFNHSTPQYQYLSCVCGKGFFDEVGCDSCNNTELNAACDVESRQILACTRTSVLNRTCPDAPAELTEQPTIQPSDQATAEPTLQPTQPTSEPTATIPYDSETAPQCLGGKKKAKTKVVCGKGELISIYSGFFGRQSGAGADNTCPGGVTACAADAELLAANLQNACNGKSKCNVKNNKKQRKLYGLNDECDPFMQVQYSCLRNRNPFQSKKKLKKARKEASKLGRWDAFFESLGEQAYPF